MKSHILSDNPAQNFGNRYNKAFIMVHVEIKCLCVHAILIYFIVNEVNFLLTKVLYTYLLLICYCLS